MIACGDCYRFAYREALRWFAAGGPLPPMVIVHGTVIDPLDGHSFQHAWVERGGDAYDWQTIIVQKKNPMPIDRFYEIWKPRDKTVYAPKDIVRNTLKHEHYGPWT